MDPGRPNVTLRVHQRAELGHDLALEVDADHCDLGVDATTGERVRFSSAILPACCRKSPQVAEILPLLYLHGWSSMDIGPALWGRAAQRAVRWMRLRTAHAVKGPGR
jgi:hypothetical protein